MKKFARPIFLHCVLPLVAGAAVYLFFRVDFFAGFPKIAVRQSWLKKLLFTLPDFCWSYSLACALYFFSAAYYGSLKKFAVLNFILVAGSEVVQIFFPQYFTFDMYDLAATILAFVLSTLQVKRIAYEEKID